MRKYLLLLWSLSAGNILVSAHKTIVVKPPITHPGPEKDALVITSGNVDTSTHTQIDSAYQQEIESWHAERIQDLKAPNGWLNLVGLYWLEEGKNSFGSGRQNKVIFP